MFTGIIEEIGTIRSIVPMGPNQSRLTVGCEKLQEDVKLGDSIAVNGICLTVVQYSPTEIVLELSAETLKHSLFSKAAKGDRVNLERALRLADRLGGHIVQGHVDSQSTLISVVQSGQFFEMSFTVDPKVKPYYVNKGSITINGISLTVASLKEESFSVAVIPHTYKETTLSALKPGDAVHIETDILARYIERLLGFQKQQPESKISMEFLREHGF